MANNIEEIEKLLKEGKKDEAKKLITDLVSQDMSDKERGSVYTDLALAYMEISNEINRKYLEELREISAGLKEIDQIDTANNSEFEKAQARKNILDS
ncbi:MAG: hypothetical protein WC080_03890 [Patescibacteria group bacterium]|jgi:hypothetical protein